MIVTVNNWSNNWDEVKAVALSTIRKELITSPTEAWKRKILLSEHSPIRLLTYSFTIHDLPYWVSNHLVRHKIGIEHFVTSQRSDRTGVSRSELPQDALVSHTIVANAQAMINISRKRLCSNASLETRKAWQEVIKILSRVDKALASVCVPECAYRGFCAEFNSCGNLQSYQWR